MLRILKVGGMTVGAGVLIGAGVIGWMRFSPQEGPAVSSKGGSVVLDESATPAPEHKDATDLRVASPGSVAAAGGSPGTLLGGVGSGSGSGSAQEATPAPKSGLPSPEAFGEYEKYHSSTTALYGDEVVGKGAEVAVGRTLLVHYRGWLTNGKLFDESYTGGNPFSFKEGEHKVILGWEEGLLGMKAGGKRRLIVPPGVGYGSTGRDPIIPPDAVLVFDIELVAVQ